VAIFHDLPDEIADGDVRLYTEIVRTAFFLTIFCCDVLSIPGIAGTPPELLVVGFVGGFVHHDNQAHQEVQLAAHLRKDYPSRMDVRMFANHLGGHAYREILEILDTDHDGTLSGAEKRQARIVMFGHSWGASETVEIARRLERDGVPVLLTIQVDSVSKPGEDDRSIPANVAQAVNFYQPHGLIHGKAEIHAADASRTQILGNFRYDYSINPVSCAGYPWYARVFMKPHIEIESDPAVWSQVEALIRSKLAPEALDSATARR
jgi:hypothetical protein